MDIPTISYLSVAGELSSCSHRIASEELIEIYRVMELTKQIDHRMITLQRQGLITFAMSSRGEEACAVASAAALQKEDWMYPQYREAGIMFWRGYTPQQYIHHMFSNAKDETKGRQMPNHFGSRALNVVIVSSPLATQLPHAAGAAYAMKMQKEKQVAITYFGEGAASKEDFHSALNFAAVRKAPVIFFCRNNGFAISTRTKDQYASDGIASKGAGYGVQTYRIDGNDVFAIHETVSKARQQCIEGKGPVLIEAMTYRLEGHSTSDDPSVYRSEEEREAWSKKCPILRLRNYLEKQNLWNDEQETLLKKQRTEEVEEAIKEAKQTAPPCLDTLIKDVYFEVPEPLKQQLEEVKRSIFAGGSSCP